MPNLLVFMLLMLASVPAYARDFRVDDIPNGGRFDCTSCHVGSQGGGDFTPFGSAAIGALTGSGNVEQQHVDWSQLYDLDSDRDGFTNGEELGDPDGTWIRGDPDPGGVIYHPGDTSKHPPGTCGDGRITPPEECEGPDVGSYTCKGLGFDRGVLTCRPNCSFDRSDCTFDPRPGDDAGSSGPTADAGTVGHDPSDAGPSDEAACAIAPLGRAPRAPAAWLFLAALVFVSRWRTRAR